jgi:hypothetical protein
MIQISKIEGARRQILTAIRLYFNDSDIVSVHTLATAAYAITKDICDGSESNPDSMLKMIEKTIKPEYRETAMKRLRNKMSETANFLKHAERDPNAMHDLKTEQTEVMLLLAVEQYKALTQDFCPEIRVFYWWFVINHPDSIDNVDSSLLISEVKRLCGMNKTIFYQQLLPLLSAV